MALTNQAFLTLHEACDHVLDAVVGGDGSPRSRRMAVRAVQEAYRELHARRQWRCYYREFLVETVASQTTGSIAYDFTGGSSERMVTLTGATWPSDVDKYALSISGVRYGISTRVSSTVITLIEQDCPQSDIASGTAYTLVRDTYDLPADLRQLDTLYDVNAPGRMREVTPNDIMRERRLVRTSSVPTMYSIYRSERYAGNMALHLAPSPSSVRRYQGYGIFAPRELTVLDYSGVGTVAVTADSAALVGTSTVFAAAHEGCVIRVSPTEQVPTSIIGDTVGNRLQPFALQRIIRTRTDATNLVLDQVSDQTLSGKGYRVSSRIDIEPGAMTNAFLRLAEALYSPQDRKGQMERMAQAERAYEFACYADQRVQSSPGWSLTPHSLSDVAASVDPTGD